jgi:hypothetical protein
MPTTFEGPDGDAPTEVFEDPGPLDAGYGAPREYGAPERTARPEYRWGGGDEWRNHWSHTDDDQAGGDDQRRRQGTGPRLAQTRLDPSVAVTRVDYDAYHEPGVPALESAGGLDDDSAGVRAEGNGGGIPLSWDDE